ncbi:helix-turn-helix domain-containing protein [Caballeronia glebae]|uniref:helix-turn-helix domain-containing protein n=1 Tax=Caballeronia glebae TaxID=1777143 RepID=UPI0038B9E36C
MEFSKRLNLCERSLSRLFLQQTGLSFRQWRQRSRLLFSLSLLEKGERVTDVAIACGYESMSAFIAAFKEQMGFTPKELFAKNQ